MVDEDSVSAVMAAGADENTRPALPEGEYAIVEVLGNRTMVGRISEVERFGTKLCAVEPLFAGELLPAVMVGGASIYQLTPCSADIAAKRQPTQAYQLPPSVAAIVSSRLLPAPAVAPVYDDDDDDDDEELF